jgi:hypothetical protein
MTRPLQLASPATSPAAGLGVRPFWTPLRLAALRHGLWLGAAFTLLIVVADLSSARFGFDAHAYWNAWQGGSLYSAPPEQLDAYLYSPAFAQAIWPLAELPWPLFCMLWTGAVAATYLWLLAPVERKWRVPLLLLCTPDIVSGNVWAFFALVLVFGLRFPAAWALPLLTKVTPVVGPVWFFARREWRSLAIALGATVGIAAISFAAAPGLWSDWVRFLSHANDISGPAETSLRPLFYPPIEVLLPIELPIAIAITVFAARRNRPWLLPVAMLFAMPVFTVNAFVMLAAIPRIRMR